MTEHRYSPTFRAFRQVLSLPSRSAIIAVFAANILTACALVPGDSAYGMRGEKSSVRVPVTQEGDTAIPDNIKVMPITAELLIEMGRAKRAATAEAAGTTDIRNNDPQYTGFDPYLNRKIDYKVGPGDILTIIIWDHPELTTPLGQFRTAEQSGTVVQEDGSIFFPYVGTINVAGRTTRQIRDLLADRLSKYIEKVQVGVRVATYRSKRVYIVGEVKLPGLQEINDVPMTVLEAVNRAGGFTGEADHSRVLLTRKGVTYRVDIQSMYENGAVGQNVLLEAGDILNIPDRAFNKIFVLGEVAKPGSQIMNKKRSTLAEALGDAGYINQDRSNPRWIYVMRGNADQPQIFHLDSRSPDAMLLADRFDLRPRDIIYVDAADVVRWNRVISNILPTAQMLNQISATDYPLFGGRQ